MKNQGFSLVEIAIVITIISVLLVVIAQPLSSQVEARRREETKRLMEAAKDALIGYAISNGRLPCPATSISSGYEAFANPPSDSAANGACAQFNGFLPASTLGFYPVDDSGFAVDAWGGTFNRLRYAVSNLQTTTGTPAACTGPSQQNVFTRTDGMRTATMSCLSDTTSASMELIKICAVTPTGAPGTATGCTATLSNKVPFLVFSPGNNAAGTPGADESHNLDSDMYFVSRTPTTASSSSGQYDDIMTWGSLNTLFARMVQAGKLP